MSKLGVNIDHVATLRNVTKPKKMAIELEIARKMDALMEEES